MSGLTFPLNPLNALRKKVNSAGKTVLDDPSTKVIAISGVSALRRSVAESRSKTGFTAASAGLLNYTHHHTIGLKGKFMRVRVAFHGMETGTWTVAGCKIAALPSAAASTTTWNAATWVAVTFSGASTGTVPARQAANKPTVYWSDWVDLPAVDRTDGGAGYLLAVRALDSGAAYTYLSHEKANVDSSLGYEVLTLGVGTDLVWRVYRQNVDGVSTIANFTATAGDTDSMTIAAVQTLNADSVLTVAGFGDSILQGERTSIAQNRSWLNQACKELSTETGYAIQAFNQGFAGRTQAQFLSTALQYIPQVKPHAAFMPVYTPNDAISTQAQLETYWSGALQFVDCCNTYGVVPILNTSTPVASYSSADNTLRRALNARVLTYASTSTYVACDMAAVTEVLNGDGTSSWVTGYDSAVPPHPSDTGYTAMVVPPKAAIRAALGLAA